jgi:MinD-like ATPase involved in chromosome partitioning or flagellar assembly
MAAQQQRVKVAVAGPVFQELLEHYLVHLAADPGRFAVVAQATSLLQLRQTLQATQPDVVIIEGALADAGELREWLSKECPCPVILVLPASWAHLRGQFEAIPRVEQVLVEPGVQYLEVVNLTWVAGNTWRVKQQTAAPATAIYQGGAATSRLVLPGLRRFAFWSSKGGVGKTTLAVNFWYRLNQMGVKALLLGFDTPDDIAPFLGVRYQPNCMEFFRRPTQEGFMASIQRRDGFEFILAPDTEEAAEEISEKIDASQPNSIESFIACAASQNYGAIVMDLPPTESMAAVRPLLQATTVVFVSQPTFADAMKMARSVQLLSQRLASQHRIPRENMVFVLNQVRASDAFSGSAVIEVVTATAGWCPPLAAAIPYDERVRNLQVDAKLPVVHLDTFREGVDALVRQWYSGQIVSLSAAPRRKGFLARLLGLGSEA